DQRPLQNVIPGFPHKLRYPEVARYQSKRPASERKGYLEILECEGCPAGLVPSIQPIQAVYSAKRRSAYEFEIHMDELSVIRKLGFERFWNNVTFPITRLVLSRWRGGRYRVACLLRHHTCSIVQKP